MPKPKVQDFNVSFLIKIDVSVDIKAESLEQAVELARKQTVSDVLDQGNNHNDNTIKVIGVSDLSELVSL